MDLEFEKYCMLDGSPTTVLPAPWGHPELEKRAKIEFSRDSITALSFGIVDALCGSDDESSRAEENRSSSMSSSSGFSSRLSKKLHPDLFNLPISTPHSPARSESDSSRASSPKGRFGPMKRMLDPFGKFKSPRSPLGNPGESGQNEKPLSCDFPIARHLDGVLKVDRKHGGAPFFEFVLPLAEDIFVAETWAVGNSLDSVYEFHSLRYRKTGTANRFGSKESSFIGQMQITCHVSDKAIVMEFVLYENALPRKRSSCSGSLCSSPGVSNRPSPRGSGQFDFSGGQEELHPELQIGAIVIELPFEKKGGLKCGNGDTMKMNVVVPYGRHGLPNTESGGPSPLIDRWRSGGGCDCGGWDVGCQLSVFDNTNIKIDDDHYPLISNQRPFELFIQGKKDKTQALKMASTDDGHYTVNFHPDLSVLQVFSICVAILHATEASIAMGGGKTVRSLQQRMFDDDDDFSSLIEAVRHQEKPRVNKKVDEVLPYFVLNPLFSPIARI